MQLHCRYNVKGVEQQYYLYFRLLEQKSLRILCPNFETAIEAIFKNYLPAKFAYTNRLDVNDVTGDIFYITYQKEEEFYILDDLILGTIESIPSIYISNFTLLPRESIVDQEISSSTKVSGKHTQIFLNSMI